VITSGEIFAERMSSVFNAEAKSLRQNFQDDRDVKTVVKQWLMKQVTDCYQNSIEKLATRRDKCVNIGGSLLG
jgi:hypothetical protein